MFNLSRIISQRHAYTVETALMTRERVWCVVHCVELGLRQLYSRMCAHNSFMCDDYTHRKMLTVYSLLLRSDVIDIH
jgi:hypothetical protein